MVGYNKSDNGNISIHALREEGDLFAIAAEK